MWAVLHGEVDKAAKSSGTSATATAVHVTTTKHKKQKRTYRVKSGDVLSIIAARTGVSLERIQALNPSLDANALQTGQVIKLSR